MRRALAFLLLLGAAPARGDELSSADRLRVVYSNQFAWSHDGLPLVTVRIAEGRSEVAVSGEGGGLRLLPDGEGGPEVAAGRRFVVTAEATRPAVVRWHVVVAERRPGDDELPALLKTWRGRGVAARTVELGTVFGVRGEVFDSRRVLVVVDPQPTEAAARKRAAELGARHGLSAGVHPELAERPRGLLVARDERGTVVKNDGILWFAPAAGASVAVDDVDREAGGRERRRYHGYVYVTLDGAGKLAVVNAVPEDRLLEGLLPAEMNASAAPEALKAQAVAARNELLAKIGMRHLTDPYRLCSTQHCQVYAGAGHEDPRTSRAVAQTRGELLFAPSGKLVDTVYSAACGGHTEHNEHAWGTPPDPSLRGRLDAPPEAAARLARFATVDEKALPDWLAARQGLYCEKAPAFRWQAPIDLSRLAAESGVGAIERVEVLARGVSGRATRLLLRGAAGQKEIQGELAIRRALGKLKSAAFVLREARREGRLVELSAEGAGHGHGVGMCQAGAMGMARLGATYPQILKHYYGEGSTIRRLY